MKNKTCLISFVYCILIFTFEILSLMYILHFFQLIFANSTDYLRVSSSRMYLRLSASVRANWKSFSSIKFALGKNTGSIITIFLFIIWLLLLFAFLWTRTSNWTNCSIWKKIKKKRKERKNPHWKLFTNENELAFSQI